MILNKRNILVLLLIVMMNLILGCENKDISKKEDLSKNSALEDLNKDGIYTWYIDLTHDGKNEKIVVNTSPLYNMPEEGEKTVSIYSGETDDLIWSELIGEAHTINGSLRIYNDGEKDYLLKWNPYMSQGNATYQYKIFNLSEEGEEILLASNTFYYSMNDMKDVDVIALREFGKEINVYLEKAFVLAENGVNLGKGYSTDKEKRIAIYDVEADIKSIEKTLESMK